MPGFMRFCEVLCKECRFHIAHRSHDIRPKVSKTVLVRIGVTKPNVCFTSLLAGFSLVTSSGHVNDKSLAWNFFLLLGLAACAGLGPSSELQHQIDEVGTQISAKEYVAAAATASDGLDEFSDSQKLRTLQLRADCGIFRNQLDFVSLWQPLSLDSEAAWELSGGERIGLKEELVDVVPFFADSAQRCGQRGPLSFKKNDSFRVTDRIGA